MEILENIDINNEILENIDNDIDIDKENLENIDIDKISNRLEFGISNRATAPPHTRLDRDSNLLDLGLFPAALLHLSTPSPGPQHLTEEALSW